MKRRFYMITEHIDGKTIAPLLRTEDRALFDAKIQEVKKQYHLQKECARLIIYNEYTIMTFCPNPAALKTFQDLYFFSRPIIKEAF